MSPVSVRDLRARQAALKARGPTHRTPECSLTAVDFCLTSRCPNILETNLDLWLAVCQLKREIRW